MHTDGADSTFQSIDGPGKGKRREIAAIPPLAAE